jgi:hypothetical protein
MDGLSHRGALVVGATRQQRQIAESFEVWLGMSILSSSSSPTATATAAAVTFISFLGMYFYFAKKSGSKDPKKRAMSFSSMTMIRGSFPPVCNVSDPIINILTIFRKLPSEKDTKQIISSLFEMYRFRAAPVFSKETNQWEFHEVSPDINNHVVTSSFETEQQCYEEIERLSKSSFDHMKGKPAWVFHRIVNNGTGKSLMLLRVHHVVGDGIALVLAIDRIFTNSKGEKVKTELPGSKYGSKNNKPKPPQDSFLTHLSRFLLSFFRVVTLATTPYDSDILFTSSNKSKLAMNLSNQAVVYLPNVSLEYVKELKTKANSTINDIMLGAMTGAIRRYCERLNDPLMSSTTSRGTCKPLQMRALLPVSFPRPESQLNDPDRCLRNMWCFISAPMPINEKTPQARVTSSMSVMESLKKSYESIIQFWLMDNVLCHAPLFFIHDTAQKTFTRHSIVFSNVPGPQEALYLGGEEVLGIQAIFPNIITQTIIVSYNGSICGNLVVDSSVVKDRDLLKETYLEELKELGAVYGVESKEMLREIK